MVTPTRVHESVPPPLLLQGSGAVVESLKLDGGLVLKVPEGTEVVVDGVEIKNKGWSVMPLESAESDEVRVCLCVFPCVSHARVTC
jgi:hypothetical protein